MFRRRRFGRRFRRGRRRPFFKRATVRFGYVNIADTNLAAATTTTITLITAADSPVTSQETDGTLAVSVDNGSRIVPRIRFSIAAAGTPGDPIPVAVLVWKDSVLGGLADPTTAQDVLVNSDTAANAMLKKNKCMYIQKYITTQGDVFSFNIRVPRRLAMLKEGESIKISISNLEATTDAVTFMAHGAWKIIN